MSPLAPLRDSLAAVVMIGAMMVVVALIETALPLHRRGRWNRVHLRPNLTLTCITFATNAVFNAALVAALVTLEAHGFGVLRLLGLKAPATGILVVLALDFSFYLAHIAMHKSAVLWWIHRVHHSDPAVDVTTTTRQHPGEGVIRYAFMAAFAIGLGASPAAFAVYRIWSALSGLVEHANVRLPLGLDGLLSLALTSPNMHKVHHSRRAQQTDTNYGNIFSLWDRLFSTFTPAREGTDIAYGLDGLDHPAAQTTAGLLAMPFRNANVFGAVSASDRIAPSDVTARS
jgi:sterol desaturase/sphingolipid hydroxylase (fatty acid hydroxylase superfamily)